MPAQRTYPEQLRERAVKMVSEIRDRDGKGRGEIVRVGRQMDVHPEALRAWVRQAEIDGGTGREPRRGNRGGSPSWRGKCESCAALMRSWRRRARISRGNSTPGFRAGRFINAHRDRFGVEPACAVLEFPVSAYYAARKREREPSPREQRDEWLKKEIMRVREDRKKGRRVYGARKVWLQLRREGIEVARCTGRQWRRAAQGESDSRVGSVARDTLAMLRERPAWRPRRYQD